MNWEDWLMWLVLRTASHCEKRCNPQNNPDCQAPIGVGDVIPLPSYHGYP